jgi:hypothetical protein
MTVTDAAAGRHGRSRPDACSVVWDDAQASALGTAPAARFWVALEQNGPWGVRAATQSHLDPDLGQTLDRMCQDAGGRFILIRRPGAHSDPRNEHPASLETQKLRTTGLGTTGLGTTGLGTTGLSTTGLSTQRVYLAGGLAGRPWLLEADLDDPVRLTILDMRALVSGDIDAVQDALPEAKRSPGPVLLVCTNSKRDVCCSVRGRPVAVEAASQRPGQVWECSHTGGHRFAPTGVVLPHGQTFGRLDSPSAVAVVDAAMRDEVPPELLGAVYDRGRSHRTAPEQAAESAVRQRIGEAGLLALSTTATARPGEENAWQCRVSHVDGRHWEVDAVRGPRRDDLPESCGRQAVPTWQWSVVGDVG